MTAICGLVQWDRRPAAAAKCAVMQRALAPYGSDRVADWDGGDVALGIGLARFLPEDDRDRQPLVGGGGRWHLVADVRLDNRPELAARLGLAPAEARDLADSDVVLRAWEAWEEAAPDRLVGDFAFAVWDARERRLHLVRDFLGQRPLFYHLGTGFAAFASMARGLHALDSVPVEPDLDRLRDYLALAPMRGDNSFFAGISRVEPGERVTIGPSGEVVRSAWYDWDHPRTVRFARDEDYVEAFRETFDRAVEDRLRASVTVASQLSGGLDSTAVTATAARMLDARGRRLCAYTHVPLKGVELADANRRNGNEWDLAHTLACRYPNIDHVPVEAADRVLGGDLEAQFHYFEYPALNICNLVWMREISRLAGRGGRSVLLSGSMGNATISLTGLERLPELLVSGQWTTWVRECRALTKRGYGVAEVFGRRTWGPFLPPALFIFLLQARGRFTYRMERFSSLRGEERESAAFRERMKALGYDPTFRPWPNVRSVSAFILRRLDISGQEFHGQIAAFNVETRDPTTDRRVVDFLHGIPSSLFLKNGQSKWLYHRAFAERVPETVRAAPKRGLQAADWHVRFARAQPELRQEMNRSRHGSPVQTLLDVDSLDAALAETVENAPDAETTQRLRVRLLRGLSVAHFLGKMERTNAGP